MSINYAERFERQIEQQFQRELTSADMAATEDITLLMPKLLRCLQ